MVLQAYQQYIAQQSPPVILSPIEYQTLRECTELEKMEFFVQPIGTLFKLTKGEHDFIMDVIRKENRIFAELDGVFAGTGPFFPAKTRLILN